MSNLTKNTVANKSEELSKAAKNNINSLSNDIKSSANKAAENVVNKTEDGKDHAISLVEHIKSLVSTYSDPAKIDDIKSDVYDKAKTLKDNVSHEVSVSVGKAKKKTVKTVRQNPMASVAVAAGVGALVGYLLASKKK